MTNGKVSADLQMEQALQRRIRSQVANAPWVLRVTEFKDKLAPALVVKERFLPEDGLQHEHKVSAKGLLKDRGLLYGQPLRRCLPIIRTVISGICDAAGIPLELQRIFANGRIAFRGNLPLDEEAGAKLGLVFKLQERVKDMDRVELMAWRVERFSREEAIYWLTRATQFGAAANRWAQAGMRIMLGGLPGDQQIGCMLEKLRR